MAEICDEAVAVEARRPSELLRRVISGGQGGSGSLGMARNALREVKEARRPDRPDAPDFPETAEWALATDWRLSDMGMGSFSDVAPRDLGGRGDGFGCST